jgi:hypothetical protein
MVKILGYGEDALTLWALKNRLSNILAVFEDKTFPFDCVVFYRPSFGRSGGKKSSEFGEFDAIVASSENVYLIESKWDNSTNLKNDEIIVRKEQELRHRIFSWYLTHWSKKYLNKWVLFGIEQMSNFQTLFREKRIAPPYSKLAINLESILNTIQNQCKNVDLSKIKNILMFFYDKEKTKPPKTIEKLFTLITLDYSNQILDNFVAL